MFDRRGIALTVALVAGCGDPDEQASPWELLAATEVDGTAFDLLGPFLHGEGVWAVADGALLRLDGDGALDLGLGGQPDAVWSGGTGRLVVQLDGQAVLLDVTVEPPTRLWEAQATVTAVLDGAVYVAAGADMLVIDVSDGAAADTPLHPHHCVDGPGGACCVQPDTLGDDGPRLLLSRGAGPELLALDGLDAGRSLRACALHADGAVSLVHTGGESTVAERRDADLGLLWSEAVASADLDIDWPSARGFVPGLSARADTAYLAGLQGGEERTYSLGPSGASALDLELRQAHADGLITVYTRGESGPGPSLLVRRGPDDERRVEVVGPPTDLLVHDGRMYARFSGGAGGQVPAGEWLRWALSLGQADVDATPRTSWATIVRLSDGEP